MSKTGTRVGFIGIGNQGEPLAARIAAAGFTLTVWARRPEAMDVMPPEVRRAASPADVGANSDVVCICVFTAQDVEQVLFGEAGVSDGAKPGTRVLIHSTLSPAEVQRIAELGSERGLIVIDAPVSGGRIVAEQGGMTVMLGGSIEDCDAVRQVLAAHATKVVRIGDVGAGQQIKLINNTLMTAHLGIAASALEISEEFGISQDVLFDVLASSSGRSLAMEMLARFGSVEAVANSQAYPTLSKDVGLLTDAIAEPANSTLIRVASNFVQEMTFLHR